MGSILLPRYSFRELTDIPPDFLGRLGIRFLMIDLDNTIAAYDEHAPSDRVSRWAVEMRRRGITMHIVSNSTREDRVRAFSGALGVGYVARARKPSPDGLLEAMATAGFGAAESALIGDQVFTDVIAANRAGIISMIVRPRRFTNPFLAVRYAMEAPFRAMGKNGPRDTEATKRDRPAPKLQNRA